MFQADTLRQALAVLGDILSDRGLTFEIVAVGGGGLLLLGVIRRPTKDLDALALVERDEYQLARPLPPDLAAAIADTARALALDDDWLNSGPTDQLTAGLPPGFRERTTPLVFGGLTIHLAGRFDQTCLKLFAAADGSPGSKHVADLLDLDPSDDDLLAAAAWVKQQDVSPVFADFVDAVINHIRRARGSR